jgi:hypothetical protein
MVISPKATAPYIRFCINLIKVNEWIDCGHYPIPLVRDVINRIGKHSLFIDADLSRSYHQFRLAEETSEKLSVQTPFGQFAPIHMPEGCAPAQQILQQAMVDIFESLGDWILVIFDNILILADTEQQAVDRFELFLKRCEEFNVILKFEETWIGFEKVKFFGYICQQNKFEMDPERFKPIRDIPFPSGKDRVSKMRSFLGISRMYAPLVEGYAQASHKLDEMTSSKFNWDDEAAWKHDYRKEFENFKNVLEKHQALFYPDYGLDYYSGTLLTQRLVGCYYKFK